MSATHQTTYPLTRADLYLSLATGLAGLALYVRTLAPSLLYGDMAEFQTLSYTLGMTHSSGYPTQVAIGRLFTLLPFGDIAYRVNLMSAVFGALAGALLFLIVRRLGAHPAAGLLASAALLTSPFFWRRAIVAESYTPAAGMLAAVWLGVLAWRHTGRARWLFASGLAGGLSLGIHSTVLMTGAAVLVYLLLLARRWRDWLSAATGALLGVALTFGLFLYLDWNDPPSSIYNTTYRTNLSDRGLTPEAFDTPLERLAAIFPSGGIGKLYFSADPGERARRVKEYVDALPGWQLAGALLGALALPLAPRGGRRLWHEGLYALIAFLLIWTFAVSVEFSVYQEFFAPAAVFLYAWLGLGLATLLDGAGTLLARWSATGARLRAGLLLLAGLACAALALWNARADLRLALREGTTTFIQAEKIYPRDPERAIKEGRRILSHVEDDAILFANWDRLYSYVYTAHIVEGRTGIALHELLSPPQPGSTTMEYILANLDSRPIYFTLEVPELETYFRVTRVAPQLYRITAR